MDRYGNGEELVLAKIFDSVTSKPSFRNFNKELFASEFFFATLKVSSWSLHVV